MNDLESMRQIRNLNQPTAPQRDLWPQIAAAIDTQAVQERRRRAHWPLALAATLAVALMLGFSAWTLRDPSNAAGADTASNDALWQPQDPRLVAAVADLDAARVELTQALATTPEAAYLHRLLARTADTRQRLQDLEQQDFGPSAG